MRFLEDDNVSRLVIGAASGRRLRCDVHRAKRSREPPIWRFSKRRMPRAASRSQRITIFGELVIRQRLKVRGMILLELDGLSNVMEADVLSRVVSTHVDQFL